MNFPFCPGKVLFLLVKMVTSLSLCHQTGCRLRTSPNFQVSGVDETGSVFDPEKVFAHGEKGRAKGRAQGCPVELPEAETTALPKTVARATGS